MRWFNSDRRKRYSPLRVRIIDIPIEYHTIAPACHSVNPDADCLDSHRDAPRLHSPPESDSRCQGTHDLCLPIAPIPIHSTTLPESDAPPLAHHTEVRLYSMPLDWYMLSRGWYAPLHLLSRATRPVQPPASTCTCYTATWMYY